MRHDDSKITETHSADCEFLAAMNLRLPCKDILVLLAVQEKTLLMCAADNVQPIPGKKGKQD